MASVTILLSAIVFASGCIVEVVDAFIPEPSLPVNVYVQDTWNDEATLNDMGEPLLSERAVIGECIAQWNEVVGPRLKDNMPLPLVLAEVHTDATFERETDLVDGRALLYKMPTMTSDIEEIIVAGGYGEATSGYGLPGSDSFVFLDAFPLSTDGHSLSPKGYLMFLRYVVCHELGHVMGLHHQSVLPGAMNENTAWNGVELGTGRTVRKADGDAFCLVHPSSCR